ncbi:MAG: hypothetical protein R3B96_25510 [Pirellulaceae bacterium]
MNSAENWNSRQVTHGWQQGVKAFFYGLGFAEGDFDRPQVGIGVPLLEGNLATFTPMSWDGDRGRLSGSGLDGLLSACRGE